MQEEATQKRNAFTGELVQIRSTEIGPVEFARKNAEIVAAYFRGERIECAVPCNGCRECCWYKRIDVYPEKERAEDLMHLAIEHDDQGYFLRKRADGACNHLGEHGCSVYAHRPRACRAYDCRIFALIGARDSFPNGHSSPAWEFPQESKEDRVFTTALRLGILPDVQEMVRHGDTKLGMTPTEMLRKAEEHIEENTKRAYRLVSFLDDMGPLTKHVPLEIVGHIEAILTKVEDTSSAEIYQLITQGVHSVQTHRNEKTRAREIGLLLIFSVEMLRRSGSELPLTPAKCHDLLTGITGEP